MKSIARLAALLALVPAAALADGPPPHAVEGRPAWDVGIPAPVERPRVFILNLADGARVTSPVRVEFGLLGMRVAPAGTDEPGTGHHHLLIDTVWSGAPGEPLPADAQHVHFGAGQRSATVELTPGEHTLQLVMGDASHVPHDPPVASTPIRIVVE